MCKWCLLWVYTALRTLASSLSHWQKSIVLLTHVDKYTEFFFLFVNEQYCSVFRQFSRIPSVELVFSEYLTIERKLNSFRLENHWPWLRHRSEIYAWRYHSFFTRKTKRKLVQNQQLSTEVVGSSESTKQSKRNCHTIATGWSISKRQRYLKLQMFYDLTQKKSTKLFATHEKIEVKILRVVQNEWLLRYEKEC